MSESAQMDVDIDVLVIGAGACGLVAAISAHDAGASVVIIEKQERSGGNSSLSTGSVIGAGTRFQRAAGIDDGPDRLIADLTRIAPITDTSALVRRLAQVSAELVEWLVDKVGVRLSLITTYKHIGHSVCRLHAPASRRGQDLVNDLLAGVAKREIPIALKNRATDLVVEKGSVTGATIECGGIASTIRARKTILALNGFAANQQLVRECCPEIAGAQYFGAQGSTGEAIIWGRRIGAGFANLEAYQGYAAVAYPHGSLLTWTTIEKGGILINEQGRRFGNESLGYSGFASIVLAQGSRTYSIFDQRIFDLASHEEEFAELTIYGGVRKADTLLQAATIASVPGDILADEIVAYNYAAERQRHDQFGRVDFGLAPLQPPLYVVRVVPGLFHTQGGLKVDEDGRVLRPDGQPIVNLFAGGGAAAGISGRRGAFGYASGNGLLSAIALGRLAALAAVHELQN